MATETITRCDACARTTGATTAGPCDPVHVVIDASDQSPGIDITYDLCGDCQPRMREMVNPRNWPRRTRKPRGK